MVIKITPDMTPLITSQMRYPLRHVDLNSRCFYLYDSVVRTLQLAPDTFLTNLGCKFFFDI